MGGGKLLAISEFYVHKQKVDFSTVKNFSAKNAKIEIKNDKLYITPLNNEKVEIIYNMPLNAKCSVKFEFGIFLSIMILSFLLFLKLTSYLADFKNVKNQSRIEIVFLTIFFVFLFVPMSHINQDKTSKTENRTLAKKPTLVTKSGEINYKYGKDFDSWFNDRFNLRFCFNRMYSKLLVRSTFIERNGFIYDKRTGLFVYKKQYDNTFKKLDEKTLSGDLKQIKRLKNFCDANGIDLYVLIIPQSFAINYDLMPYKQRNKIPIGKQYEKLFKENQIEYLYPYEKLCEINTKLKESLYYDTDTHMTDTGMYFVYSYFMEYLNLKYQNLNILDLQDFNYRENKYVNPGYTTSKNILGDGLNAIFASDKFLSKKYKEYDIKYDFYKEISNSKFGEVKAFEDNISKKNVYLIGSSYTRKFMKFLPYSFNVYKIQTNNFNQYQVHFNDLYNDIIKNKIDIVILCFNEGSVRGYLKNMYKLEE